MRTLTRQATILFTCVALAWLLEIVDQVVFRRSLDHFGIRPRTLDGLSGILFAPLLHGGWQHLAANTLPFVVLGWLVMLRRLTDFVLVSAAVVVVGGLAVWLVGAPNSVHIGASGLIFGYLGYLLARGYFERSWGSILLAGLVAVLYGGVLCGVLPGQPGVSWEGHLFGLGSGVGTAKLLATPKRTLAVT